MKQLFAILVFSSFAVSCSHAPLSPSLPAPAAELREEMNVLLAHGAPNRSVNEPGHETAFRYLQERLNRIAAKRAGASVHVHRFMPDVAFAARQYRLDFRKLVAAKYGKNTPEYRKWKAFTDSAVRFVLGFKKVEGKNLILEIPGTQSPKQVLWIGAHFDTITHDHQTMTFNPKAATPGADDNASGVAAVLRLAEHFASHPPLKTLRFVLFDYEEIFFLGSYALAGDIQRGRLPFVRKGESTAGLLNLEMIGWSSAKPPAVPVVKIYARETPAKQAAKDLMIARLVQKNAKPAELNAEILQNGFNRSDNWSFWQKGIPSVCVSEDWERDFNEANYHTSHDGPETVNFLFLQRVTDAVREAVTEWST